MTTTARATVAGGLGREPAALVLEDGHVARGTAFGALGTSFGEAVFATGMSGYQETLTDPSYRRQIVIMTAPHVGITGMNDEDDESSRIWVSGFVVRDPARRASSWRATATLNERLAAAGVVGVGEVDTRAVTRRIRGAGAMRAGVFAGPDALAPVAELLAAIASSPTMVGADLSAEVSTALPYTVAPASGRGAGGLGLRVVAVDLGIKSMTPRLLAERGIEVIIVPWNCSIADIAELAPDGLFFSNGPGDPQTAEHAVTLARWALSRRLPLFGICFGNQVLGRALGLGTYKLKFGHRGINQPVMDLVTRRVEITAQNHGFAVDAPVGTVIESEFGGVQVSHVGLNDGVVEGLHCLDVPALSVQYHPEAAAGPHDSAYLFDRFVGLMLANPQGSAHAAS